MSVNIEQALEVAKRAVEAAAKVSLPHYQRGVVAERKLDRSPVTAADRESEAAILGIIKESFPTHAILAEESGVQSGDPRHRWIVDPLDGTRGFTRGGSFWGPLVGFEVDGQVVAGAMGMPVLGDVYWAAKGMGCWKNGSRLRVSSIGDWSEATLSVGELQHLLQPPYGEAIAKLIRTSASTRGYGDPAGCALVLLGRAEVWLESGVKTWDLAPMKILIEEAGGRFTAFDGSPSIETGTAIGSNGLVHDQVLATLRA
jgi:histidinol-phosphatase